MTERNELKRFVGLLNDMGVDHIVYKHDENGQQSVLVAPGVIVDHIVGLPGQSDKVAGYMVHNPSKVGGYSGFYADWVFDAEGKFLKTGAWE